MAEHQGKTVKGTLEVNPHLHREFNMIGKVKVTSDKCPTDFVKDPTLELSVGLTPLGKNVAVIPEDPDKITPGGIHLPDICRRRSLKATVFAIGPDVKSVACGDVVFLPDHSGVRFEFGADVILVYNEDDLLAKEEK